MTINRLDRSETDQSGLSFTALIGDVIRSRSHPRQAVMLEQLREALERVNRAVPARQPLEPTIGDEFQGLYETLDPALSANLLLSLYLHGQLEVRVGIGRGRVEVLSPDTAPRGQSGPAWWLAREAIDEVKGLVKGWPAGTRSRFKGEIETGAGLVNAFLLCQDQILSRMDDVDARIAIGVLSGARQKDLEQSLEITQSTVSTRARFNGPAALVRAYESLRQERSENR